MGWPQPDPEAVERATAWLREQDPRLSLDGLAARLRDQGYSRPVIDAAVSRRRAELDAALPPGSDLRGRASAILIVAFLATWGVISIGLLTGSSIVYNSGGLAALILGVLLLPMLLVGLAVVRSSRRLRRGAAGAIAIVLVVPFIYLVVVAGLCVATTRPFGS